MSLFELGRCHMMIAGHSGGDNEVRRTHLEKARSSLTESRRLNQIRRERRQIGGDSGVFPVLEKLIAKCEEGLRRFAEPHASRAHPR